MNRFLEKLLSEEGSVSSMRVAFLCWMTVITLTICGGILIVIIDKKEFPDGMWAALAGLGGTGGIGFAFKYLQKRVESKGPTAPPEPE